MKAACALLIALVAMSAGPACAFGTINLLGQHAEHEKITRRALACPTGRSGGGCLEAGTLDELAGKRFRLGAVGFPDLDQQSTWKHCDDGDWLPLPGYPRAPRKGPDRLRECRDHMAWNLAEAVRDAAGLLGADGRVNAFQASRGCNWGPKGRAKCNVLQDMGLVLHASQDFYSHANWTDHGGGASVANPPGLGHAGPAPFIGLRGTPDLPRGLITGCYPDKACIGRVTHTTLNKDMGQIGVRIGKGDTPRGRENDNFRFAVEAAVADTRDKWSLLRERLVATYGAERGGRMICAIGRDDPKGC